RLEKKINVIENDNIYNYNLLANGVEIETFDFCVADETFEISESIVLMMMMMISVYLFNVHSKVNDNQLKTVESS
ncbi:hypothetical protein DERF_002535, partial [Dermatophagoides farinae]